MILPYTVACVLQQALCIGRYVSNISLGIAWLDIFYITFDVRICFWVFFAYSICRLFSSHAVSFSFFMSTVSKNALLNHALI